MNFPLTTTRVASKVTPMTNPTTRQAGTRVNVTHDMGVEAGTVIGSTNPRPGEQKTFSVKFDDGTISEWPAFRVSAI